MALTERYWITTHSLGYCMHMRAEVHSMILRSRRGRGTATNPHNRFAPSRSVAEDDGWYQEVPETQNTEVIVEANRLSAITSPDLPFDPVRPIPIAAANTAVSIATHAPATPIGTCRRAWISKPG